MLKITKKNCYKCDLETINNTNNQHFWVNLTDFEVETERNWINIFNKYGNSSTLKYRKELTPNIQFQLDKIFSRNDLFEPVIKSYKATNVEFLMRKEKLGLCPYEVICAEQEFIVMLKIRDTDKELIKKLDKKLIEQSDEKLIEQTDDKLIEQTNDELTGQTDDELIEQTDDELFEQTDDELFEQTDDKLIEQTDDELIEQTDDELIKQ